MTTTQQTPKFSPDQRVEVYVTDFDTPGFPKVWKPATVTSVERREDRKFDVFITRDDGVYAHQIVGSRGGNSNVRPVGQPTAIIAQQTYRGATIQTQRNGYISVIIDGHRQGGLVSIEEAQAYIQAAR